MCDATHSSTSVMPHTQQGEVSIRASVERRRDRFGRSNLSPSRVSQNTAYRRAESNDLIRHVAHMNESLRNDSPRMPPPPHHTHTHTHVRHATSPIRSAHGSTMLPRLSISHRAVSVESDTHLPPGHSISGAMSAAGGGAEMNDDWKHEKHVVSVADILVQHIPQVCDLTHACMCDMTRSCMK